MYSNLSIVIPLFQSANWIEKTLEALGGDGPNSFEVIIVDDGSTDNGLKKAQDWLMSNWNGPWKCIQKQENGGAFLARCRGTQEASGEWITFLDADDDLAQTSLISWMKHTQSNVDVVVGRIQNIDKFGQPIHWTSFLEKDELLTGHQMTQAYLDQYTGFGTVWAKLIRRSILQPVMDELKSADRVYIDNDNEVILRCYLRARFVALVARGVYNWRDHENASSHGNQRRMDIVLDKVAGARRSFLWLKAFAPEFLPLSLSRWEIELTAALGYPHPDESFARGPAWDLEWRKLVKTSPDWAHSMERALKRRIQWRDSMTHEQREQMREKQLAHLREHRQFNPPLS